MYNRVLQPANEFNAGIYIRLSQEDRDKKYESQSESIKNQKEMLSNYVKDKGFNYIDSYIDDGYSGTNFDRPGFQKLLEDIESKKINLVIVKDLSRLGRDHIMTGYYMENFFPLNNVRFISILESYDSFKTQASNDTSTFIIAVNDYYSKQNSIKIRSVLNEKKKKGQFIGSLPSYGYMRDPNDKGKLIPNPETAPIVKKIFQMVYEGYPKTEIVDMLNNDEIKSPSMYKNIPLSSRNKQGLWTLSSLSKILKNQIYCGDMIQNIQANVSYKSNIKRALPREMWIIVENTHEALVSKKMFREVNYIKPDKIRKNKTDREKRIFENLLVCKECGNGLGVMYRKKKDYWTVNCNKYARNPKQEFCHPHFFPYDYLEEQLINKIKSSLQSYMDLLDLDEINQTLKMEAQMKTGYNNDYDKKQKELEVIERKLKIIYEDKLNDIIDEATYLHMQKKYLEQKKTKTRTINKMKSVNMTKEDVKKEVPDFQDKIKKLLDLNQPTRELIFTLIERIEIDQYKEIEIFFRGNMLEPLKFKYEQTMKPRNPYGRKGK